MLLYNCDAFSIYCFHPWYPDGYAGCGKNFDLAVSQKFSGVRCSYLVETLVGGVGVQHHVVTLICVLNLP